MTTPMTILLVAVTLALAARSFTLSLRYLQDGVAYLRHGEIVVDLAMPVQGSAVALTSGAITWAVLALDPDYPSGGGILPLAVLGAAGAMGLLIVLLHFMGMSDMRHSIAYRQPLFLRDRTPGCRSARHITVHLR